MHNIKLATFFIIFFAGTSLAEDISILSTDALLKQIGEDIDNDFQDSQQTKLSEKDLVKLYQQKLNSVGCPVGKEDGIAGPTTNFAYQEFCAQIGVRCTNADFKDDKQLVNFTTELKNICRPLAEYWNAKTTCTFVEKGSHGEASSEVYEDSFRALRLTSRTYSIIGSFGDPEEPNRDVKAIAVLKFIDRNAIQFVYDFGLKLTGHMDSDRQQLSAVHRMHNDEGIGTCKLQMRAKK